MSECMLACGVCVGEREGILILCGSVAVEGGYSHLPKVLADRQALLQAI